MYLPETTSQKVSARKKLKAVHRDAKVRPWLLTGIALGHFCRTTRRSLVILNVAISAGFSVGGDGFYLSAKFMWRVHIWTEYIPQTRYTCHSFIACGLECIFVV
jgi:hypothetical protein